MSIWHPFTQHGLEQLPIKIKSAEGVYLHTEDGRKIIDGISSWWVNTHGHCHTKIVRSVQAQAAQLEQVIFAGFTHEPAENLAQALLNFSGDHHSHVFFSDSGSTSVEVALKMAIGAKTQQGKAPQKILALEGGYHGDTFGAMSAGGRSVFNALYEPFLFDVVHLPFPGPGQENECLSTLEKILKSEGNNIAAFIFEPLVQGAGGMRFYSAEILKKLCDMCRARGIFLIADEVMTGFGRTGTRFACEQAGVVPDLMCLSKGLTGGFLPMGATLASEEIYRAFYHKDRGRMFYHSSSYAGNALACAAAVANLRIWQDEPVQARIDMIADVNRLAVQSFEAQKNVSVRSLGIIFALDIKGADTGYLSTLGPKLYAFFLEKDVLLRPLGNIVYSLPPYCITKEELEHIHDVIRLALDHIGDAGEQRAA
ncbi:MAG: adenosylmethionine--8-amino-7-oxononanoate transaminase [Alphaproteobacteria bacterium]